MYSLVSLQQCAMPTRGVARFFVRLCNRVFAAKGLALWSFLAVAGALPLPVLANVSDLPEIIKQSGAELRPLGSGRFRWFGLHIYDAALWTPPGQSWNWDQHFVLDIQYARDLVGKKIADASVDEIVRLGITKDQNKLAVWRELMHRAFPDVKKGQRITGSYHPNVGATFYHEGRVTEVVSDLEFARAFFSIWLDPRTREPKLRAKLLGL